LGSPKRQILPGKDCRFGIFYPAKFAAFNNIRDLL
jgi:hypothetical protein